MLNAGGMERVTPQGTSSDVTENQRATIYMAVVLYSVAALAAVRFVGACWFLVGRLFRGV